MMLNLSLEEYTDLVAAKLGHSTIEIVHKAVFDETELAAIKLAYKVGQSYKITANNIDKRRRGVSTNLGS